MSTDQVLHDLRENTRQGRMVATMALGVFIGAWGFTLTLFLVLRYYLNQALGGGVSWLERLSDFF